MDLFCLVLLTVRSTVSIFSGIAGLEKRISLSYIPVISKLISFHTINRKVKSITAKNTRFTWVCIDPGVLGSRSELRFLNNGIKLSQKIKSAHFVCNAFT